MKSLLLSAVILGTVALGGLSAAAESQPDVRHAIVAVQQDRFHGWPANNGVWQWGNEILVGFTQGDYVAKPGHNIAGRQDTLLSRSRDGGETWEMFDPQGFLDDENQKFLGEGKVSLPEPVNFRHPGFALRIFADGYHGNQDPEGGFFYSLDRGDTWRGPYAFTGLMEHPEMQGKLLSPRTDYLVLDRQRCLVFFSAHTASDRRNRMGCMQTTDGGRTFEFVSWVTPEPVEANAIMSQTVQLSENEFFLAYRKIYRNSDKPDTIEAFHSTDGGRSWELLGTVKVMQVHSNPPAVVKLKDGRLCCAYGDRQSATILARYSDDNGRTWGPEVTIRDGYQSVADDPDSKPGGFADMGYVRLVQRPDGKLVAIYYWATAEHPQHHIAASIWQP